MTENLIFPLLVILFSPFALLLGSRLESGDWLVWIRSIPTTGYLSFVLLIAVSGSTAKVVSRLRTLKQKNLPHVPTMFAVPLEGYMPVGELKHQGVKWIIQIPAPGRLGWPNGTPQNVDVDTPPRCANCRTELEETETFFGMFRWACLACGHAVKNKMSYHHEAVRAEKLASAWWENTGQNEFEQR